MSYIIRLVIIVMCFWKSCYSGRFEWFIGEHFQLIKTNASQAGKDSTRSMHHVTNGIYITESQKKSYIWCNLRNRSKRSRIILCWRFLVVVLVWKLIWLGLGDCSPRSCYFVNLKDWKFLNFNIKESKTSYSRLKVEIQQKNDNETVPNYYY